MHCVNEYVSYGTQGICQIEAIRSIQFEGCSGAREYYVLHPIDRVQSSIFVPVDNQRLTSRMRPVLSPEEIDRAILSVKRPAALLGQRPQAACRAVPQNPDGAETRGLIAAGRMSLPPRSGRTQGALLLGCAGAENGRGYH